MEEHPGEAECVVDDRVLGAIAVTRGKPASTFWSMSQANYFCLSLASYWRSSFQVTHYIYRAGFHEQDTRIFYLKEH